MHFGDDFAELVLESDSKTKKPPSDPNQAALVKAVFDHLDSDERNKFRAVKENVDKEVHMKCVITALSTAYLDADTALKISAVIEQQSSFSAEDKARLQKAVGDQVRCNVKRMSPSIAITNMVWQNV